MAQRGRETTLLEWSIGAGATVFVATHLLAFFVVWRMRNDAALTSFEEVVLLVVERMTGLGAACVFGILAGLVAFLSVGCARFVSRKMKSVR